MDDAVVITGGCGDIGLATATEFARAGQRRLALCDLLEEREAEARLAPLRDAGAELLYRRADVTDSDAAGAFVDAADAAFGGIGICLCNAGIVERGPLIDLSSAAWRRTLDVNLTGCFLIAQAAARAMVRRGRGGHIVLLSSWTQDEPRASIGAYCVSKSGLKMLARCMALELGPSGIRVNVVAPGFVDAGLTGRNLEANPDLRAGMEASTALGRLTSADELARTIRLFCSPDAAYVTGSTLLIDGGSSLHPRRHPVE